MLTSSVRLTKRNSAAKNGGLPAAAHEIPKFSAQPEVTDEPVVEPTADIADVRGRKQIGGSGITASDERIQLALIIRIGNVIVTVGREGSKAGVPRNHADLRTRAKSFSKEDLPAHRGVADEFAVERSRPGDNVRVPILPERRRGESKYQKCGYGTNACQHGRRWKSFQLSEQI